MKTVLILHGIGGHSGIHWQQWLHDELKIAGYDVLMPELPDSDHPDRQTWLNVVKEAVRSCDPEELVIVGHSLGVTTALDYIEQNQTNIDGLVAVSGFAEKYGLELNEYFLAEKAMDFTKITNKLSWSSVFYGDDDAYVPQDALSYVADNLRVKPTIVSKGGHLNSDTGYTEFPALLSAIKAKA